MKRFTLNTAIYFEERALDYLQQFQQKRVLLVCDAQMSQLGHVAKVEDCLKKQACMVQVFADIDPDPNVAMVTQGLKQMQAFQPELVIALGGGSVIDTAKGMLYAAQKASNEAQPLFVCIPTTSGTGSEVTAFSVLKMQGNKLVLIDEKMAPDVAILDTRFVQSVPPHVTADTGLDTLCHAIEAYVSTQHSDFSDALAEKAIKLVFDYLLLAYKNGADLQAREKMHHASCLAGIAFTNAALGINHSIAHAIGGIFHLPHGRTNAILMPHVMAYNAGLKDRLKIETAERYAELAKLLGIAGQTVQESCEHLLQAIRVLNQALDVPPSFAEMQVTQQDFKAQVQTIAALALEDNCTSTTPRVPTKEAIVQICSQAFRGG